MATPLFEIVSVKMKVFALFCLIFVSNYADATLSKDYKRKSNDLTSVSPGEESLLSQGVVSSKLRWKDIVKFQSYYSTLSVNTKNFSSDVLGYVTPWNNHGYDVAKTFGSKVNLISPVWLQIKPSRSGVEMTGMHDMDPGWIREVKKNGAKIVPRVIFEHWSLEILKSVLKGDLSETFKPFIDLASESKFDGYVLELWLQFGGGHNKQVLTKFIQKLSEVLKKSSLLVYMAVPPPVYQGDIQGFFDAKDFSNLVDYLDGFSLMTYDYSSQQRPGPNAPITWVERCVKILEPSGKPELRRKILLGLNMYGYEYTSTGGGPILGTQFIDFLKKKKPKIEWDEGSQEHFLESKNPHQIIFYPTPYSIYQRIQLAEKLGTGLSLWELGQGLDCFYDLL